MMELIKWKIHISDGSSLEVTDSQMKGVIAADAKGARFAVLDEAVINLAFISSSTRKLIVKTPQDLKRFPVESKDKKFIVSDNRKKIGGKK